MTPFNSTPDAYELHPDIIASYGPSTLISAILSDTLNLRSPTTTAWDERVVAMLVQYLNVTDVNELAAKQFRAKSHSLSLMTQYALVNGDVKQFKARPIHWPPYDRVRVVNAVS